jgi:hypothetical protein
MDPTCLTAHLPSVGAGGVSTLPLHPAPVLALALLRAHARLQGLAPRLLSRGVRGLQAERNPPVCARFDSPAMDLYPFPSTQTCHDVILWGGLPPPFCPAPGRWARGPNCRATPPPFPVCHTLGSCSWELPGLAATPGAADLRGPAQPVPPPFQVVTRPNHARASPPTEGWTPPIRSAHHHEPLPMARALAWRGRALRRDRTHKLETPSRGRPRQAACAAQPAAPRLSQESTLDPLTNASTWTNPVPVGPPPTARESLGPGLQAPASPAHASPHFDR